MKINCIYIIKSKLKKDRVYIGSAIDFFYRKRVHLSNLKLNKHHSGKLQNHFNKYTIDDLSFEIIERIYNKNILLEREQYYIDYHKPYFNICKIAGSSLGLKRNHESKLKMSIAKKGNKIGLGYKQSIEHKNKISKANKNQKRTLQQKITISISHIGIGKGVKNLKYIQDNIKNKTQYQIAAELGICQSTISKILKRCA